MSGMPDYISYYESFRPYCKTQQEVELIEMLATTLDQDKVGHRLGISGRTVRNRFAKIKNRAVTPRQLVKDFDAPLTAPLKLKGTSTLYDAETGAPKISWVKTDIDKEAQAQMLIEAVQNAVSGYKPFKKISPPKQCWKDILTVYPMGDPHLGMYAWSQEAGEDFDCDIAERDLRKAMAYLIEKAPPSETAIILNLGDFFHSDSNSSSTTKGTPVDVDGRWARVLEIGVTLMIDCVTMALKKHKKVIVKNNIGNHDSHTSQVLSICMSHAFKNEPRVEIANPANKFFVFEFGRCMLFSTHGDGLKPKQAQGFVSNAYSEIWGRTEHRFALFGHFHHEETMEQHGLIMRIFNTLASSDAWHHASGFRSKRNMKSMVFDKIEGLIEEYTFNLPRQELKAHGR